MVGAGGHLRQVGHAQHLPVLTQAPQQAPHGGGHGAADAGIHLVEHQRAGRAERAGGDRDGQGQARQFTTGCYSFDSSWRRSGVG